MIFINDKPQFQKFQLPGSVGELYYAGIFDRSVESIFRTLDNGRFPVGLKGNFGLFFKNEGRVVFAVDHANTYNMHWRDGKVSHIYSSLREANDKHDPVMDRQRRILFGTTIGIKTIIEGIYRLEAGTYFEKDLKSGKEKIEPYIDLFNHEVDPNITLGDLSDITEQIIEEQTRNNFSLLWSSGTDSNCVYGFIRKLKRTDRCTLVSLYSDFSPSDERFQIKELENAYGVKTNYYNLRKYVGITDDVKNRIADPNTSSEFKLNYNRIWKGAQYEHSIFQKYISMVDLKITDTPMLTGEPGDLIFGSTHAKNFLNVLTQQPNISSKKLSELFVCGDMWLQRRKFFQWPNWWDKFLNSDPINLEAWGNAVDWFENHWNNTHSDKDIINKIDAIYYQFKAPKLLYGYSQFSDVKFVHPFLDYRMYHAIFKTPGHWRMKDGKIRRLSMELIKDYVDERPWTVWPKSGIELVFLPRSRNVEE